MTQMQRECMLLLLGTVLKRKTSSSTAAECVEEITVVPIDSQLPLTGESSVSIGFEFVITDDYSDCAVLPLCPPKEETLHCANPWLTMFTQMKIIIQNKTIDSYVV